MGNGRARVDVIFRQGQRNVTGAETSKSAVSGVLERGPFTKETVTSPEAYRKVFGGVIANANAEIPQGIKQFFDNGGTQLTVQRIAHYTDITDPDSYIAVKGSKMLQNAGSLATAASDDSTNTQPFVLAHGDTLDVTDDIGGLNTATFNGTIASHSGGAVFPIAPLAGGENFTVDFGDGSGPQTITAAGGETTNAQIANLINSQAVGGGCSTVATTGITLFTDKAGTGIDMVIAIGAPDLAVAIGLTPATYSGGGNVADIGAVTGAEVKTLVEAASTPNVTVTVNGDGTVTIATATTGVARSLTIGGTARTKIGLAIGPHAGSDATPEDTLLVEGKTEGAYANDLSAQILAASNGDADYFDLLVLKGGEAEETFTNLIMTVGDERYVETIVNDVNVGSNLIAVTDQLLGYAAAVAKPAVQTAVLIGGDDGLAGLVDADFIGSEAGYTGLYAFDDDEDVRMVSIPGRATAAINAALNAYVIHRKKRLYAVHPTPKLADVANTAAMKVYAVANTFGTSEFGCIAWPRIEITNPSSAVFGTDDTIYVDPSMSKMGAFARNDHFHPDGVFTSTAGTNQESGTIVGCLGVESDELAYPGNQDLLADVNVEPIVKFKGTNWHWDGGDNLKTDGDWPRQWHARAAIYTAESIRASALWIKHTKNTRKSRGEWERSGERFLSILPDEAFDEDLDTFFEVSDALNPRPVRAAGQMKSRLALGFSDDAKQAEIEVTRSVVAGA